MLKQVQMTDLDAFGTSIRCYSTEPARRACPEACPKMILFGVSVQGSYLGSPVGLLFEPLLRVIPNLIPDLVSIATLNS